MNSSVWSEVICRLAPDHRCVVPDSPVGSHSRPTAEGADLSPAGLAALLGEFLDALDLRAVTLVVNDLGYPLALAAANQPRVSALVLTPCEAFDEDPSGLPGAVVAVAGRVPGGLWAAAPFLSAPGLDRLPFTLGRMSRRPVPRALIERWTAPARHSKRIRADPRSYIRTASLAWQQATTGRLRRFRGRALVCWAADDEVMLTGHGPLLRDLLRADLVVVPGSGPLMPLDAPDALAGHIRAFVDASTGADPP